MRQRRSAALRWTLPTTHRCRGGTPRPLFWQRLHERRQQLVDDKGRRWTPVFVLDQFEEVFTLQLDERRRRQTFEELGDLLENRVPPAVAARLDAEEASSIASTSTASRTASWCRSARTSCPSSNTGWVSSPDWDRTATGCCRWRKSRRRSRCSRRAVHSWTPRPRNRSCSSSARQPGAERGTRGTPHRTGAPEPGLRQPQCRSSRADSTRRSSGRHQSGSPRRADPRPLLRRCVHRSGGV